MNTTYEYLKLALKTPIRFFLNGIANNHEIIKKQESIKKYGVSEFPILDFPSGSDNLDINPYIFQPGNSTIPDILLLIFFSKNILKCNFLEIGSWRGETLKNLEQYCETLTSLTLGKEEMKEMGISESFIVQNGLFQKDINKLKQVFKNTHSFDFADLNQKFDLIFIDGDHSYAGVLNDTKKVFQNCVHENTVVVWHDYKDAQGIRYSVLAGILNGIPESYIKNVYHIQDTLCAVYIPSSVLGSFNLEENKKVNVFSIQVNIV